MSTSTRSRDRRIIDNLFKLAQDVEGVSSARLACCIVIKNNIIAYGFNQKKSHPFQAQYGKNEDSIYLHAETDAIKNALRRVNQEDLTKATLYIVRAKYDENGHWAHGLSKPCSGCARAIAAFGIKNVVYTTEVYNSGGNYYKYL
jgi:deoxycytidylate deaminase